MLNSADQLNYQASLLLDDTGDVEAASEKIQAASTRRSRPPPPIFRGFLARIDMPLWKAAFAHWKVTKGVVVTEKSRSVAGRTFRWTFNEGPTAGKTYEHTFNPDGTVVYREANDAAKGRSEGGKSAPQKKAAPTRYAAFEVAPETHMVSYLADSGFTLTVAMNLQTRKCYGVASNDKQWFPVTGTLEAVK